MEEQDPQETAVLSDNIPDGEKAQMKYDAKSVYSGLVEIAKSGGKLFRTNGKMARNIRFDLTTHSVFIGSSFIVRDGKVAMPVLETAGVRVDLSGLPWLTMEERDTDPISLYYDHWMSRPNGTEKFMASNFPAEDIDEMSDDAIICGIPRGEARVRLEAWMLCAAMDGTLESYVTGQSNWIPGSWWWSPASSREGVPPLVIKTAWWKRESATSWTMSSDSSEVLAADGTRMAVFGKRADPMTRRAIQSVPRIMRLAKSLAHEAFSLQMRSKCYDMDPLICELNKAVDYIETGIDR